MQNLILYFSGQNDGPGKPGGWGYHVRTEQNQEVLKGFGFIHAGPTVTCNTAEWLALQQGIERLTQQPLTFETLTVRGNSQLVIKQISLEWRVKKAHHAPFFANVSYWVQQLNVQEVLYEWIPQGKNERAIALSNQGRRSEKQGLLAVL